MGLVHKVFPFFFFFLFYFYCSCKQPELNTLLLLQGEKGLQGPKGNPGPAGLGQKGDKVMLTVTVTAITNM